MSGGSFNYLCFADHDEIIGKVEDIESMAAYLTDHGFHDAAAETEDVAAMIKHFKRRVDARLARLNRVWQAAEWHASCDWGIDSVHEAIAKYRADVEPPK